MTVAAITSEIQKLAPSSVIELFVLDLALFGQGPVRFTPEPMPCSSG